MALGIGGPLGIFAALLHTLNHSLAKTLLFCGSGNVLLKYGTRDLNVGGGMLKIMPFTAVLFGGGALALAGMPPFNIFLSESTTVTAGLARNHLLIIVMLLLLLTLVLAGLAPDGCAGVNGENRRRPLTGVIRPVHHLANGDSAGHDAGDGNAYSTTCHQDPGGRFHYSPLRDALTCLHNVAPGMIFCLQAPHLFRRNTVNVNSSSNCGEAIRCLENAVPRRGAG